MEAVQSSIYPNGAILQYKGFEYNLKLTKLGVHHWQCTSCNAMLRTLQPDNSLWMVPESHTHEPHYSEEQITGDASPKEPGAHTPNVDCQSVKKEALDLSGGDDLPAVDETTGEEEQSKPMIKLEVEEAVAEEIDPQSVDMDGEEMPEEYEIVMDDHDYSTYEEGDANHVGLGVKQEALEVEGTQYEAEPQPQENTVLYIGDQIASEQFYEAYTNSQEKNQEQYVDYSETPAENESEMQCEAPVVDVIEHEEILAGTSKFGSQLQEIEESEVNKLAIYSYYGRNYVEETKAPIPSGITTWACCEGGVCCPSKLRTRNGVPICEPSPHVHPRAQNCCIWYICQTVNTKELFSIKFHENEKRLTKVQDILNDETFDMNVFKKIPGIQLFKTNRGLPALGYEGYGYKIDKKYGKLTIWRCLRKQGCYAKMKFFESKFLLEGAHSHPPDENAIENRVRIATVKTQLQQNAEPKAFLKEVIKDVQPERRRRAHDNLLHIYRRMLRKEAGDQPEKTGGGNRCFKVTPIQFPKTQVNHFAVASPNQFARTPPDQFRKNLPDHFTKNLPDQFLETLPNQFLETPPHHFSETPPNQMAESPPNQMAESPPNQMAESPPNQMAESPPNQMAEISPNQRAKTPPNQMAEISPNQMAKTPPNQVAKTPPNQVAKTPPNQMVVTPPNQMAETPPNQMAKTTPNQMTEISPNQMAKTPPNQRAKTPPNQMAEISPNQRAKTPPNQVAKISPNQFAKIPPNRLGDDTAPNQVAETPPNDIT